MAVLLSIIAFIVILGILVVAHEFGHYWVARRNGMRVYEFAVGMGPKIFSFNPPRKTQESGAELLPDELPLTYTEFTIRAFPIGGFVRIAGMDPDEAVKPFGFHSKSHSARAAVLFAGPVMNLILPIFVFAAMAVTTGMPKFTSDGPVMQLSVDSVKPKSEAARIGLRKGDVITSVDGQPCDFEAAIETIHRSIGKPVRLGVKRGDTTLQLVGTPQAMRDDNGKLVLDDGKQIGVLGFVPFTQWQLERIGLLEGVARGATLSFDVVRQIVTNLTPSKLSKEGAGVIEIGRTTHSMVEHGIAYLLFWLALLSLNLAVINLLPIPVLDGGHLMILFADKLYGLMRKGATLSARTVAALNYLGLATLLTIFILFMINDINRIQQ